MRAARTGCPESPAGSTPAPPRASAVLAAALALASLGCGGGQAVAAWGAMPFLYRDAPLPAQQIVRDVPYCDGSEADAHKHQLDLFLPAAPAGAGARGWPVLVFVHGGGWTHGDRAERFGGRDVYANIGRFFAARGVGAAVVSYRLQPAVGWPEQVEDVARAAAWVHAHIAEYGGDGDALFLAGHSAGAQLAARVALDPGLPARLGVAGVCGLVAVSGAGYDLTDEETYRLGADPGYYERRFRAGAAGDDWRRDASAIRLVGAGSPPALVLFAEGDWPSLQRQARLLDAALARAGVPSLLVEVPDADHYTIVPALSRDDRLAAPAILAFVRGTACGAAPTPASAGGTTSGG